MLCIYSGPAALIPVVGTTFPPGLQSPTPMSSHLTTSAFPPGRTLFSRRIPLSTLAVKPFVCTSVTLHLALETWVGRGCLFPPLGPSALTLSENILCLTALRSPPGNTFPRASVTCENSFQTRILETGWQMKSSSLKLDTLKRHWVKCSGNLVCNYQGRRLLQAWPSERGGGTNRGPPHLDSPSR